jgi:flagellar hook-associated protein 3 FlgL
MSIVPVPSTRVSDSFVRERLIQQVQSDQIDLFKLQNELSTGSRLNQPSDDPSGALQAVSLQNLIAQKQQYQTNLQTNTNYLSASDAALMQVDSIVSNANGIALGAVGSTATDTQRQQAATQLQDSINQLLGLGNTVFGGRYIFSGSATNVKPFVQQGSGVVYQGDPKSIQSYADSGSLFVTNVSGDSAFGGFSQPLGGTDLNPILTGSTPLAQLNGGQGISRGSIQVSDGTHTSTVDLSSAATIGDVAKLIEAHPPTGRLVTATVTNTGLDLSLDSAGGGSLIVSEVGGGITAAQLGIKQTLLGSTGPLIGADLNPTLQPTTPLSDILGVKASVDLNSIGGNNNVIVQANTNGTAANGTKVVYVNDAWYQAGAGITAGNEFATYATTATPAKASLKLTGPNNDLLLTANAPGAAYNNVAVNIVNGGAMGDTATASYSAASHTLTLSVDGTGQTSTASLIAAINADGTFTAARDATAEPNAAGGFVSPTDIHNNVANTYLTGGDPNTLFVHIQSGVSTANQAIAAITATGAFTASLDPSELNNDGSGTVTDAVADPAATGVLAGGSGENFDQTSGIQIVNGGKTYTVTFATAKTVEDVVNVINGAGANVFAQINPAGTGVTVQSRLSGGDFSIGENGGQTATQLGIRTYSANTALADLNYGQGVRHTAGGDFTIQREDGVQFTIDISSAKTVGDVLGLINNNATNLAGGVPVVAQLDTFGNGIELVDDDPTGTQPLTVTSANSSLAANDLGLLSASATTSVPPTSVEASGTAVSAGPNNDLVFTAAHSGTGLNGVQVQFVNSGAAPGTETVNYNAGTRTLSFNIGPATTANAIISVLAADPTAGPLFTASLTPTDSGSPNDGSGIVSSTAAATLAGGTPQTISGSDTNPQQLQGIFSAMVDLQGALKANDNAGIQRAMTMLTGAQTNLSYARAELGAHEQTVSAVQGSLQTETTELQGALSNVKDVNMPQAISAFLARQTSYQAALQVTGLISKLTLLNYI